MSLANRHRAIRQGFTLIELLVVMAIIAVLVSITVPAVMKAREVSSRTSCANNLRQFGIGMMSHQQQYGYLPTAGVSDFAAPTYAVSGANLNPIGGFRQDAGWGFQVLPFIDAEPIWDGSGTATTAVAKMQAAIAPPLKVFFCPSRRAATQNSGFVNAGFPSEAAYSTVKGQAAPVALTDYAGCNGTVPGAMPGNGAMLSQAGGRNTISTTDIRDGVSYTILLGEKAGNPRLGLIAMEDDMGYFSGYGSATTATNFNTIRFTSLTLLPLRDLEVTGTGVTGGAFGSAHAGAWNALMADGSVQQISYTLNSTIFQALGTIQGQEIISDMDLGN